MLRGKLIVLEGPDGVGKSTQWSLIKKRLQAIKIPVRGIKFPQYERSFFGKLAKQYLMGKFGNLGDVDPHLVALIYAGDRWQAKLKIVNWLQKGYIVIADRYLGSNIAHQGARVNPRLQSQFIRWLENLELETYQIPKPDFTIMFSLEMDLASRLIGQRGNKDILEQQHRYLKKVHDLYDTIARKYHWEVIAVNQGAVISPPQLIHEAVWATVAKRLSI